MQSTARPFPSDPQWLQLSRKLPPDAVVECLVRFGFRPVDIARRFDTAPQGVTAALRRRGMGAIAPDHRTNGCRLPYRVRLMQGCLTRQQGQLVMRYF